MMSSDYGHLIFDDEPELMHEDFSTVDLPSQDSSLLENSIMAHVPYSHPYAIFCMPTINEKEFYKCSL